MLRSGRVGLENPRMDHGMKVDMLQSLMSSAANDLPFDDFVKLDNLTGQARQFIKRIFPGNEEYLEELKQISFTPGVYSLGGGRNINADKETWEKGRQRFINLCTRLISELNMDFQEETHAAKRPPRVARTTEPRNPDKLEYLQWLLEQAQALSINDEDIFRQVKQKTEMVVRKFFGQDSPYSITAANIHFSQDDGLIDEEDAKQNIVNLIETMIDDLSLGDEPARPKKDYKVVISGAAHPKTAPESQKVFIVHGHDNEMKIAVARALEKLGLESVILHERPDQGKTVIEKFIANSDVGFAVILLSGDDLAYPKTGKPKRARPRARQNVILELGFFVGKLGRERVL